MSTAMTTLQRRARRLDRTLAAIARRFGPGVVARLRDRPARDPADHAVPTGSVGLDRATGLGGLPRGHLTEILGPESCGKTTLLYATLAAAQRAGGLVALIDAEGSADGATLAACGVDLDALVVARPASARDALLLAIILARCGGFDALGFASLAALRDLPGGTGRETPVAREALETARLLTRGLRVLTAALADSPTAVIATNRLLPERHDTAAHPAEAGGEPGPRTVGGLALRHFAALRIAVTPLAALPDTGRGTGGLRVLLTVAKHKLGVPGGTAVIDLVAGGGVDRAEEVVRLGLAEGLLTHGPLGVVHRGATLAPSPAAARRRLAADADLLAELAVALRATPTPRVA